MQHSAPDDVDRYAIELLTTQPDRCVARYRANYRLGPEQPLTEDMVRQHWLLERALTRALLDSSPADRAAVAERAYTALYRQCPWLTRSAGPESTGALAREYGHFARLLRNRRTVYEVGSGQGRLIRFLAGRGHVCVATEITSERGRRLAGEDGVAWHTTDGVHLGDYEPAGHYDAVISTQVVEHLHPEDIGTHCANVRAILATGGIYVFDTPHRLFGPSDLSRIFGLDAPVCMHLKEYTYAELARELYAAGFSRVEAVFMPPRRARGLIRAVSASQSYLDLAIRLEAVAGRLAGRDVSLCATK